MATRAHDIFQRVRGTANIGAGDRTRMATQAVVQNLPRRLLRESEYRSLAAARLDMRLAWPVTTFTSSVRGSRGAAGDRFVMWVLIEVQPDIGMASLACIASYVLAGGRLLGRH